VCDLEVEILQNPRKNASVRAQVHARRWSARPQAWRIDKSVDAARVGAYATTDMQLPPPCRAPYFDPLAAQRDYSYTVDPVVLL